MYLIGIVIKPDACVSKTAYNYKWNRVPQGFDTSHDHNQNIIHIKYVYIVHSGE